MLNFKDAKHYLKGPTQTTSHAWKQGVEANPSHSQPHRFSMIHLGSFGLWLHSHLFGITLFLFLITKILLAFWINLCHITYRNSTKTPTREVTCQEPADARPISLHVKPVDRYLQQIELDNIARSSKFYQRTPQKITALAFVTALCNAAYHNLFSYRKVAFLLGLLGVNVSKQAVSERFNRYAVGFIKQVLFAIVGNISGLHAENKLGAFKSFNHVFLTDSTNVKLPPHLADAYPGSKNQSGKKNAGLKIQATFDIVRERLVDFGISAFTRTDQTASKDILDLVQPNDLIIRDLGYFVLPVFEKISKIEAFFLSRFKLNVAIYCPKSGKRLNLLALLKKQPSLDINVLIGSEQRLPVRLVAIPVPKDIANERRRKAKNNRDRRCNPSKETLKLLGWQLFVTNVSRNVWSPLTICKIYAIRWRIEIIFKVWKSHLSLASIPEGPENQLDIYIYSQLLNAAIFHAFFDHLNRYMIAKHDRYISILKVAPLFDQILNAMFLLGECTDAARFEHFLEKLLLRHCCYEKRKKRINYAQQLQYLECLA